MRGKRLPPKEPVDAKLDDIERQYFPFPGVTIVAVRCSRCMQGLPDLLRIPRAILVPRSISNPPSTFFQTPMGISPNDLYIARGERYGWQWEGTTLWPTSYHLERQRRAQEAVRTQSRTETVSTRQALGSRSRKFAGSRFSRPLGQRGNPWIQTGAGTILELAPDQIVCPQCRARLKAVSKSSVTVHSSQAVPSSHFRNSGTPEVMCG